MPDLENIEERVSRLRTDLQTLISEGPSEIVADLKAAEVLLENAEEDLRDLIEKEAEDDESETEGE